MRWVVGEAVLEAVDHVEVLGVARNNVFDRTSGVEAPDVSPTVRGPSGSQLADVISPDASTGLCRISPAEIRAVGSAMWNVGRRAAQMRAKLKVLLLL